MNIGFGFFAALCLLTLGFVIYTEGYNNAQHDIAISCLHFGAADIVPSAVNKPYKFECHLAKEEAKP